MAPELTSQVLEALDQANGSILSADAFPSVDFTTMKSALDRLGSRSMIIYRQIDREEASLTPEAEGIAAEGSHEAKVFEAVRQAMDGLKIADLPVRRLNCTPARLDSQGIVGKESAKVGQGKAFKEGWIKKDKDLLRPAVSPHVPLSSRHQLMDPSRRTVSKIRAESSCRQSSRLERIPSPKSSPTYGNAN
ncbi:MAG: hypothetical protein Q9207_007810 [Kuettlingeria erythrocarpa]